MDRTRNCCADLPGTICKKHWDKKESFSIIRRVKKNLLIVHYPIFIEAKIKAGFISADDTIAMSTGLCHYVSHKDLKAHKEKYFVVLVP